MIELVYYPPYHSKYNRIERCWGVLEQHWNGTQLTTLEIAFAWAKSMTCCPRWTQSGDDNLSRSVNSRGLANTLTTLRRAFVKKLPRELTVLPRSGFVGTFLLSGCLNQNQMAVNPRSLQWNLTFALPSIPVASPSRRC